MSDNERAELVDRLYDPVHVSTTDMHQAADMIRVLVADRDTARQQLADAPHMEYCQFSYLSGAEHIRCTCWKAGL